MSDEKILKDAQYRKGLSIAFFNATNNALEIVKVVYPNIMANGSLEVQAVKDAIALWRDWLLEEHKTYYATVISSVGKNYKIEDSVEKLKNAKSLKDLRSAWVFLSEDERKNEEIIKVAQELRKLYEEA